MRWRGHRCEASGRQGRIDAAFMSGKTETHEAHDKEVAGGFRCTGER